MTNFDPVVLTVFKDEPAALAELRIMLQRQALTFRWWIIDLSEKEENREIVRSWSEVPFLSAVQADGDPAETLAKVFKLIEVGLLMLIDPGYRIDAQLLPVLVRFLKNNRDKAGAYVPIGLDWPVGDPRIPPHTRFYGPDTGCALPAACAMLRVDAIRELENPWDNLIGEFCKVHRLWPAITGESMVRYRPADALVDLTPVEV